MNRRELFAMIPFVVAGKAFFPKKEPYATNRIYWSIPQNRLEWREESFDLEGDKAAWNSKVEEEALHKLADWWSYRQDEAFYNAIMSP